MQKDGTVIEFQSLLQMARQIWSVCQRVFTLAPEGMNESNLLPHHLDTPGVYYDLNQKEPWYGQSFADLLNRHLPIKQIFVEYFQNSEENPEFALCLEEFISALPIEYRLPDRYNSFEEAVILFFWATKQKPFSELGFYVTNDELAAEARDEAEEQAGVDSVESADWKRVFKQVSGPADLVDRYGKRTALQLLDEAQKASGSFGAASKAIGKPAYTLGQWRNYIKKMKSGRKTGQKSKQGKTKTKGRGRPKGSHGRKKKANIKQSSAGQSSDATALFEGRVGPTQLIQQTGSVDKAREAVAKVLEIYGNDARKAANALGKHENYFYTLKTKLNKMSGQTGRKGKKTPPPPDKTENKNDLTVDSLAGMTFGKLKVSGTRPGGKTYKVLMALRPDADTSISGISQLEVARRLLKAGSVKNLATQIRNGDSKDPRNPNGVSGLDANSLSVILNSKLGIKSSDVFRFAPNESTGQETTEDNNSTDNQSKGNGSVPDWLTQEGAKALLSDRQISAIAEQLKKVGFTKVTSLAEFFSSVEGDDEDITGAAKKLYDIDVIAIPDEVSYLELRRQCIGE